MHINMNNLDTLYHCSVNDKNVKFNIERIYSIQAKIKLFIIHF